MNESSILNLMMSHHALLAALLKVYRDDLFKNPKSAAEALEDFEWELDKHIFTEEKVIFRFCKPDELAACAIVKRLEQEHTIMLEMVQGLKQDLEDKAEADAEKFEGLMLRHVAVEETELYPRLDQELSTILKEEIIGRINEIPMKKL